MLVTLLAAAHPGAGGAARAGSMRPEADAPSRVWRVPGRAVLRVLEVGPGGVDAPGNVPEPSAGSAASAAAERVELALERCPERPAGIGASPAVSALRRWLGREGAEEGRWRAAASADPARVATRATMQIVALPDAPAPGAVVLPDAAALAPTRAWLVGRAREALLSAGLDPADPAHAARVADLARALAPPCDDPAAGDERRPIAPASVSWHTGIVLEALGWPLIDPAPTGRLDTPPPRLGEVRIEPAPPGPDGSDGPDGVDGAAGVDGDDRAQARAALALDAWNALVAHRWLAAFAAARAADEAAAARWAARVFRFARWPEDAPAVAAGLAAVGHAAPGHAAPGNAAPGGVIAPAFASGRQPDVGLDLDPWGVPSLVDEILDRAGLPVEPGPAPGDAQGGAPAGSLARAPDPAGILRALDAFERTDTNAAAWVWCDGHPADGPAADAGEIAVVNLAPVVLAASIAVEPRPRGDRGATGAAELAAIEPLTATLLRVVDPWRTADPAQGDRAIAGPARLDALVRLRGGGGVFSIEAQRPLAARAARVAPPGLVLGALRRDWTMAALVEPSGGTNRSAGAPGGPEREAALVEPGAIALAGLLHFDESAQRWRVYLEAFRPDADASERVLVYAGIEPMPVVIDVPAGSAEPALPRAGLTLLREADRWRAWVDVPPEAIDPDTGLLALAVERWFTPRPGRPAVRSGWPRAALPWQHQPARRWIQTRSWRDDQ